MQVKVFNEGVPGSSMWIEPAGTWEKILAGKSSPDGKYISVNTARRLIAEAVDAWWEKARSQGGTLTQGHDWCGSEGGTPRKMVSDDEIAAWPPGNYPYDEAPPIESASDRAERIASEIGDRKHDRQVDEI